jgi:uncharacterized protein
MLEAAQQRQQLRRRVDDDVCGIDELAGRLVRRDRDADADLQAVERAEGVEIGRVVARVERPSQPGFVEQLPERGPLVGLDRRADLEHLAPEPRHEAGPPGAIGDPLEVLERLVLALGFPVVERNGQPLVLDGPVDARSEVVDLVSPATRFWRELEAVRAHVAHPIDPDEPARFVAGPAADAGDECVAADESPKLPPRLLGNARLGRALHDRRERPVYVQDDRSQHRGLRETVELGHGSYDTAVRLIAIGLVAGFFSALFGVGGGIVVVPLLILLVGFEERPAMATSLASIGLIAAVGTISYAVRGDVNVGYGLLLGLPAAAGAIAGTALQQRVAGPALSYGFAALLAAVGIWLLV